MLFIWIFLFLTLILGVGLWGGWCGSEFFLAGRRAGAVAVGGSLLATCLGGSATVGIVAKAYERGWSAFWWLGAGSIGLALLGLYWVGPMRRVESTRTLAEWVGQAYGAPARVLAAFLIAVMWTGVIAAQLVAAGAVLKPLFGLPMGAAVAMAAAVAVFYTAWGGQRSVLRTDILQIAMIALAVLLPLLFLTRIGVQARQLLPAASDILPPAGLTLFEWVSLVLVVGGMYVVGPDMCSRVLVARNEAVGRRGALAAALGLLLFSFLITLLGVAARMSGMAIADPQTALPTLVHQAVPGSLAPIVSLGILAALLSSADTCLLTAASVVEIDLLGIRRHSAQPASAGRARLLVCGFGIAAAATAWLNPRIIGNIMLAYAFFAGGLLGPLLILRWPVLANSVPRPWVWLGIVTGGVLPLGLLLGKVMTSGDFFVRMDCAGASGVAVCLAVMLAGALFGRWHSADKRAGKVNRY